MLGSIGNKTQLLMVMIFSVFLGVVVALNSVLSLAIPFGILAVILAFFYPHVLTVIIMTYVILIPKINVMNVPGTYVGVRGEDLLVALIILVILGSLVLKKLDITHIGESPFSKYSLLYIIACSVSLIVGILLGTVLEPLVGLMFLFRKVEYFSFVFVGYIFAKKYKLSFLINLIHFLTFGSILIGILQQLRLIGSFQLGNYIPPSATWRIMSMFSGPYEYSAYLVLILPIYLWILFNKKIGLGIVGVLLILYSLYLTQARIALLAALIILFASLLLNKNTVKKYVIIYLIAITMTVSAGYSIVFQKDISLLPERFETVNISDMITAANITLQSGDYERFKLNGYGIYNGSGDDVSFLIRINKWADLLDGFVKYPVFGLGPSSTNEAVDGNYVRYIAESGIVGFALWVLVIISVYKMSDVRNDILAYSLRWGLFGLLIIAIFIDIFEASKIAMFLWFLVGYFIYYSKTNKLECS